MNDHELDLALADFGSTRVHPAAPPVLRQRLRTMPLPSETKRRWLPQSPNWRFRSVFSATRFVVAGVIVALFGGFLLAGVLTQQSEERGPAVGASASAAPTVEPTAEVTAQQQPDNLSGTFSSAGTMAEGRRLHTATLLDDGRVLVVGGWGGDGPEDRAFTTAEVWDPMTASFQPAGTLAVPRASHTATLLDDGRVLVVGGLAGGNGEVYATAEVWDPATGSFEPAVSLARGRTGHAATLLDDGRLLVVGGLGGDERGSLWPLSSAELWDPDTATFEPAGSLATGRRGQAATLLDDGRVLLVGDDDERHPDASAVVWDRTTEAFTPAGTLARGRVNPTATLLGDGRVLVVGGFSGGDMGNAGVAAAEVWDPATATFEPAGSMADGRDGHTATLLPDGRVLIVGDCCDDGSGFASSEVAEVWDPLTASFGPAGSLMVGRSGHTATLLPDGRVLVIGGVTTIGDETAWDEPLASAEVWELDDGQPQNDAEDPTTLDLLPSVDLVTEEVESGVYRVLSDGTGRSLDDLQMLFAASDGTVWAGRDRRVFRLGVPGSSPPLKRTFNRYSFSTADSGNLRAANHTDGLLELRDGRWVELDPDTDKPYPVHPDASEWQGLLAGVGVRGVWSGPFHASDGSWWFGLADPSVPEVLRHTPDGAWERVPLHGAQGTAGQFIETPDGTLWATAGSGGISSALFRFDGERWERVEVPDDGTDFDAQSLRLDDQDRLVVNGMLFDADPPRRVDIVQAESGWSVTPFIGLADRYPVLEKANLSLLEDDDTGWAIAEDGKFLIYLDDKGATRLGVPFRSDAITPSIHRYVVAPDGALWFTIRSDHPSGNSSVGEGLYVITPEAVAAAE